MAEATQLSLFDETPGENPSLRGGISSLHFADLGTFKDSMRAPIHSWFRYPAGYSYRFVDMLFAECGIGRGDWVYDPFSGTGTTLVCAKQRGFNAYGVEAHSFVHWVADVKLFWEYDFAVLRRELERLLLQCRNFLKRPIDDEGIQGIFPELIYKCYHLQDLKELYLLREFITHEVGDVHIQNILKLALTDTLRNAAAAGTGWPYIAPNKNTGDKPPKKAAILFEDTVWKMYRDLASITRNRFDCEVRNILGDSRQKQLLENDQVALALTSPPYLNNYDYADRTRLETYFWGITKTWKDITEQFRNKLIVAATTQVIRSQHNVETVLSEDIKLIAPEVYQTIQRAVLELSLRRRNKGGKKDYDLMTALYFNDMLPVIRETYRILRPGGKFFMVLGDSAPYGVHIATETLIGRLGLAIGFSTTEYIEFRIRGKKWKDNPQRHDVPLREGTVILTK